MAFFKPMFKSLLQINLFLEKCLLCSFVNLSTRMIFYFFFQNPNESEELDLDSWNDPSVATINKPVNLAPGEFPSPRKKCTQVSNRMNIYI